MTGFFFLGSAFFLGAAFFFLGAFFLVLAAFFDEAFLVVVVVVFFALVFFGGASDSATLTFTSTSCLRAAALENEAALGVETRLIRKALRAADA